MHRFWRLLPERRCGSGGRRLGHRLSAVGAKALGVADRSTTRVALLHTRLLAINRETLKIVEHCASLTNTRSMDAMDAGLMDRAVAVTQIQTQTPIMIAESGFPGPKDPA